jgi:hypothetical protein
MHSAKVVGCDEASSSGLLRDQVTSDRRRRWTLAG